jgi:Na+/H+ antiporter NhaC
MKQHTPLRSTRWLALLLFVGVWVSVGFLARQWEVFTSMTIPIVSLAGAFIVGKSWRPSSTGQPPAPTET